MTLQELSGRLNVEGENILLRLQTELASVRAENARLLADVGGLRARIRSLQMDMDRLRAVVDPTKEIASLRMEVEFLQARLRKERGNYEG